MKKVTLFYKENHMYKNVKISPVKSITIECEDSGQVEVPVVEGVAYAPVAGTKYIEILAALKDTPEELAKNPDVKLVYVEDKKEG